MDAIEQILDLDVPQHVRVAPNGKHIVYATTLFYGHKKGEHAISSIWLADVGKERSARQLTSGLFNDTSPQWSPDGSSIAFISDRAKAGEASAIYQLPLAGGEAVAITKADNQRPIPVFSYSPDGKYIALLSADEKSADKKAKEEAKDDVLVYGEDKDLQRLRLVHVSTKVVTVLVSRDVHINDFVWRDNNTDIVFSHTKTPEFESAIEHGIYFESVATGSKATKQICTAPTMPTSVFSPGHMQCVKDQIYLVGNATGGDVALSAEAVHKISLEDGKWSIVAGGEVDCAMAVLCLRDSVLVRIQSGLEDSVRTLDGKIVYSEMTSFEEWHAWSNDGQTVLAMVKSNLNKPSEVFSLSPGSSTPVQLSNHGHFISDPIGVVVPLSVKSADGKVSLDGIYVAPKSACGDSDKPKSPLPTFVQPHGGPYGRVTNEFMPDYGWVQFILRAGYAVMFPNYRGSSSHGEPFAACARDPGGGTVDHEDVITLTQHCIEQSLSDPSKLIIGGWSNGGFHTYLAAVRNGTHAHGWNWRGAIAGAGITDTDTMAQTSDICRFEEDMAGGVAWMQNKADVSNRTGSAIWEFAEAARAGRIPDMLLLHGEKDVRVPLSQAWAFQRACRRWNVPCEMVTYPRAGEYIQGHIPERFEVETMC